jgi:hypothetical protein
MSSLKKSLIKIVVGVALMYGGWMLAEQGDKRISLEDLQAKEKLCKNAATALGIVRDSVTQTTVKLAGVRVKMYTYKYDYMVNGQIYLATHVTNQDTPEQFKKIWFDKNVPSLYATTAPCEDFENYKKNKSVGSKAPFYIFGILGMIIGLGVTWGTIKSGIVSVIKGDKK